MDNTIPKSRINITLDVGDQSQQRQELPLKLLCLGAFAPSHLPLKARSRIQVRADSLNQVMASLAPRVEINDGHPHQTFYFKHLDDFSAAQLAHQSQSCRELIAMRHLLKDIQSQCDNPRFKHALNTLISQREKDIS